MVAYGFHFPPIYMSALKSLCQYSSDSDDDDENLQNKAQEPVVLRQRFPVPNLNTVKFVSDENHTDQPDLHEGRVRTFPHVRGNWSSYVYIQYPKSNDLDLFCRDTIAAVSNIGHFLKSDSLHVSLSRTVTLRYHQIKTFTSSLQELITAFKSFELSFSGYKVYLNEEGTRTFLSLSLDTFSSRKLNKIIEKVDTLLEDFRLPKYYKDPSYHMSLLWCTGNCEEKLTNALNHLNKIFSKYRQSIENCFIDKVCCKCGNKNYQFKLED